MISLFEFSAYIVVSPDGFEHATDGDISIYPFFLLLKSYQVTWKYLLDYTVMFLLIIQR
jgi:hypothetical protein